jgi:hypothetical protein
VYAGKPALAEAGLLVAFDRAQRSARNILALVNGNGSEANAAPDSKVRASLANFDTAETAQNAAKFRARHDRYRSPIGQSVKPALQIKHCGRETRPIQGPEC